MTLLAWGIIALLLVTLSLTAYAAWRGAPFVPVPHLAAVAAVDLAGVAKDDVVVDFGAGDGRVLAHAAARGARAIGYELSPLLWLIARLRTWKTRARVQVRLADAFHADFTGATVVFLFLIPRTMSAAGTVLRATLRPGSRIVSYAFPFPAWKPTRVVRPEGCAPLYLYTVPTPVSR